MKAAGALFPTAFAIFAPWPLLGYGRRIRKESF
jgi:hypothetical protein